MVNKEASARIKINKLLEDSWWLFEDSDKGKANIQLEPGIKYADLGDDFENATTGGVVRNLNSELVRNVIIPLPSLAIQKQIVEKIEAERALVESSKKHKMLSLNFGKNNLKYGWIWKN